VSGRIEVADLAANFDKAILVDGSRRI